MTSSKISSAPCSSQSDRNSGRYAGRGSTTPMLAGIGSMMQAAI